jgi:hypothetical protein
VSTHSIPFPLGAAPRRTRTTDRGTPVRVILPRTLQLQSNFRATLDRLSSEKKPSESNHLRLRARTSRGGGWGSGSGFPFSGKYFPRSLQMDRGILGGIDSRRVRFRPTPVRPRARRGSARQPSRRLALTGHPLGSKPEVEPSARSAPSVWICPARICAVRSAGRADPSTVSSLIESFRGSTDARGLLRDHRGRLLAHHAHPSAARGRAGRARAERSAVRRARGASPGATRSGPESSLARRSPRSLCGSTAVPGALRRGPRRNSRSRPRARRRRRSAPRRC